MGENTSPVLSPSHLAHVVLRTTPANYTVMTSFYKTFLGAHASYENDVIAFLTYDHEHHRVAITAVPGTVDRAGKAAGMEHFAFTFDGLNGLVKAYEQRKERGILPEWCINHGPTVSMYYRDPDGNRVECQVDVFETVEETTKFMESEEFKLNPIGVDFDPEDLKLRLDRGEPPAEIMKRKNIGARGLESMPGL